MRLGDLKCETSGWNNITFGSQGGIGIIHSFSDFHLRMIPCDLELFGGGASVGRPFGCELKKTRGKGRLLSKPALKCSIT